MVRSSTSYLLLHYVLLVGLIFLVVGTVEVFVTGVPLWAGILLALAVGLAYPRLLVLAGYAPESWEP